MATIRMFVGHQLLLTIFLVVLLWSLYAQLRKQDFFRWWAWAWTSFAGYLAIGALALQLAPAWTLLKGSLVLASLVCGFLQIPLLAFGACALRGKGKPSRVWIRAGIVVAVVVSALIFAAALYCKEKPFTSFAVRTLPRTLALTASLFFCTWVFVGQWRGNRSLAAVITGGFCSLYALDQTLYSLIYLNQLVPGLAAQFPPLSFKLLLNPLPLFLDSVFEFGICLGIVLLLVEEHQRTELALLKSDERADALAETNAALQAEITDRKRAGEALRASEDRYRDLVQYSNDLICTHDLKGNILSSNPAGTRISGYSQDELLSMNLRDILAPQVRDQFENYLAEIQAKGIASGSMLVQTKSGEKRILEYENSMRTRDNTPAIVRGTARDVTERKQAERETLREKAFSEAMLDSLPGIFYLFDQTGQMRRWNRALEAVSGYSAEEIAAMRPFDFFQGEDRTLIEEAFGEVFEKGTANAEAALVSKDGRRTPHYLVGVRLAVDGVPCCIGTGTDLTARKHLEEQLQQAQKMEAVGRLAGGVAHDFNNILMAIQMNGSLLAGGLVPPDRLQEKARDILASADRGAALTRQLLAFGRKQVLEPKALDLNDLLRGISSLIRGIIPENISVTATLCNSVGLVKADPHQLELVIINLVNNACDAMPNGGQLIIETSNVDASGHSAATGRILPPGRFVMVAVSDTGIGMDPATQARIFEPFFTTRRNGGGTGLGLAMAYGTVKQSGGYIFVYSARDQGTTFNIFLPIVDAERKAVATAAEPNSIRGRGETILLVEDEDLLRKSTAEFLSAYGYVVLEARSGAEALQLAMSRPSDIAAVVTDMIMPGIDGREVVGILRQLRPQLRAVLMSGYTERKAVEEKEAASFTFLQKPFTAEVLASTLRKVISGS